MELEKKSINKSKRKKIKIKDQISYKNQMIKDQIKNRI